MIEALEVINLIYTEGTALVSCKSFCIKETLKLKHSPFLFYDKNQEMAFLISFEHINKCKKYLQ
ncbi:hypothetical protein FLAVO9R_30235 [Flavobacterium sp. 9R]|nr:hypothetical protein FLAVO9R_30235 [Flavobacterium sp. 9R]